MNATKAVFGDPVERRAYVSRLKFLVRGTEGVQAWGLEYRGDLTGRFAVPVERLSTDRAQVHFCPPDCSSIAPLSHLYKRRHTYRLHETVAHTANGGTLATNTAGQVFFARESIAWPHESVLVHGLDVPEIRQVGTEVSQPATIFPTTRNYYHWLVEDLPLALRASEVSKQILLLAYAPGLTDRHRLVASHLGLEIAEAPLVVRLHEQVLPGRAEDYFFIHPEDLTLIRSFADSLALASEPARTDYPDRIYVSRRYSRRSLPDEATLEDLLSRNGFEVIYAEELPWIEQIRVFQRARTVVGPHGAGLTNLVFAREGTSVIELTTGAHYSRSYEWMCHLGGMSYQTLQVDGADISAHVLAELIARRCT